MPSETTALPAAQLREPIRTNTSIDRAAREAIQRAWSEPRAQQSGHDPIAAPSHYRAGNGIEAIDVVEGFDLNPALTQVVTYVLRADKKGEPIKDLEKAQAYLAREIARRKHFRETGERYLPIGQGFSSC